MHYCRSFQVLRGRPFFSPSFRFPVDHCFWQSHWVHSLHMSIPNELFSDYVIQYRILRICPYYNLLKYLLFLLKHPVYIHTYIHTIIELYYFDICFSAISGQNGNPASITPHQNVALETGRTTRGQCV
jgi:hypothetical protein